MGGVGGLNWGPPGGGGMRGDCEYPSYCIAKPG